MTETIFDTHAHIDSYEFPDSYREVISNSLAAGVEFVNIGTNKQTSQEAVRIAGEFGGVYACVGLHPDLVSAEPTFDYEWYRQLAQQPKVVGIGECGLDYYRKDSSMLGEVKALQNAAFVAQVRLANELGKAVVIHCRASSKDSFDAYHDLLQQLDEHKPKRFVVHGYTANAELAEQFVSRGGCIALNGIITFDKTGLLNEVIERIGLGHIVLETDAPYLAPVPLRGQKNEPRHVLHTARFLAERKGLDLSEVIAATTANARRLFSLA